MTALPLPAHLAYNELKRRYGIARRVWQNNAQVREAADMIGLSEREYCDRYIAQFGPLLWTATNSCAEFLSAADCDLAFYEARP